MKIAARFSLPIVMSVLACALAACGSSSQGAGSWDAAPTIASNVLNLGSALPLPSQTLQGWGSFPTSRTAGSGNFTFIAPRSHQGAYFELTGSGAPPTKEVIGPAISVQPGRSYTFSAWIDGSNIVKGSTWLWVSNNTGDRLFWKAAVPGGKRGRYGFTVEVPEGITTVRFGFYTAACSLPQGKTIVFSAPLVSAADSRGKHL
jgi:hypothetical protein